MSDEPCIKVNNQDTPEGNGAQTNQNTSSFLYDFV